jgi:sugar phosphate isomerase/epimerase
MFGPALLHSVSYSGSWGQKALGLEAFVDKAAAIGFEGVMLMAKRPHLSLLDYGTAERRTLRAKLESHGMRGLVIAGYTNFTADLEHGEVPQREIQTLYVEQLAELAHDLGGGMVRIFTGYESGAAPWQSQWNLVAGALRECARRCLRFPDVVLGVQNHHDIGVGFEAMRDLIQSVNEPNCRAMFDGWAPALHGDALEAAGKALGPWTVHTTVADYQMRARYRYQPALVNYERETAHTLAVPMGEGFIDYSGFFTGLARGGFRGSVAYEMCSQLRDGGSEAVLDRYAGRFLEWLKDWRATNVHLCENRYGETVSAKA